MDSPADQSPTSSKSPFVVVAGHATTIVAALLAVRITLLIPRIAGNFVDSPIPPPPLTAMVFRFYPALLLAASAAVVAAVFVACRYRTKSPPTWVTILLVLSIGLQVLLTGYVMIMPAIGALQSLSDPQ